MSSFQAPKFYTLAIKISCFCNLDLVVTKATIIQNFSWQQKSENNIFLKTENFREKIIVLCNILLKTEHFRENINVL